MYLSRLLTTVSWLIRCSKCMLENRLKALWLTKKKDNNAKLPNCPQKAINSSFIHFCPCNMNCQNCVHVIWIVNIVNNMNCEHCVWYSVIWTVTTLCNEYELWTLCDMDCDHYVIWTVTTIWDMNKNVTTMCMHVDLVSLLAKVWSPCTTQSVNFGCLSLV